MIPGLVPFLMKNNRNIMEDLCEGYGFGCRKRREGRDGIVLNAVYIAGFINNAVLTGNSDHKNIGKREHYL